MVMPSLVIVTGGIGSGKTTLCGHMGRMLPSYKVASFDVDVTPVVWQDMEVSATMLRLFGTLDRKAIKDGMFSDPSLREQVNALFGHKSLQVMYQIMADNQKLIFEIPLLYEFLSSPEGLSLSDEILKYRGVVVNVTANTDIRMKRVVERDQYDQQLVSHIIAAQASDIDRNTISHITWDTSQGDAEYQAKYLIESLSQL